jgi:hypothetical protein
MIMTGKVLDRETAGFLILIIPIAAALVLLFTAWKWILLGIFLLLAGKVWQSYYWIQWSNRINPFFNALVLENQGKLTPIDLSIPTNMSAKASQNFLEKKAAEFGARKQQTEGQGMVYYFLTGKAYSNIFESSQPVEAQIYSSPTLEPQPLRGLGKLLDLAEMREEEIAHPSPVEVVPQFLSLSQAELAKRLETNSSTVGRRKVMTDFPLWSQSKDPEGIAWAFDAKKNVFIPAGDEE